MTPDEVVARAREMVGQEVLLTVRGVVTQGESWINVKTGKVSAVLLQSFTDKAQSYLVDIQPAPIRIEPGALYRNGEGELLRGDSDGGLQGFDGYIAADEIGPDSDLVRVKVVDA